MSAKRKVSEPADDTPKRSKAAADGTPTSTTHTAAGAAKIAARAAMDARIGARVHKLGTPEAERKAAVPTPTEAVMTTSATPNSSLTATSDTTAKLAARAAVDARVGERVQRLGHSPEAAERTPAPVAPASTRQRGRTGLGRACAGLAVLVALAAATLAGLLASVDLTDDALALGDMGGNGDATAVVTSGQGPSLGSGAMFDAIADNYDLTNKVLSLGADEAWRRELVASLDLGDGHRVLDLATGTADVAIAAARFKGVTVVGVDPSGGMLALGRRKVAAAGLGEVVTLLQGDAQDLRGLGGLFAEKTPSSSGGGSGRGGWSFDSAAMSFGIRNVPDRAAALKELSRLVKPGGAVALLEFSEPREGVLAPLARLFVRHVVPRLGALLSGLGTGSARPGGGGLTAAARRREYAHLQRSIAGFPSPAAFRGEMEAAGLEGVASRLVHPGGVYLYTATAPA